MKLVLYDAHGQPYTVPSTIALTQLHVGGETEQRLVRAYGASAWHAVGRDRRAPSVLTLSGTLATDRDDASVAAALSEFKQRTLAAVLLVLTSRDGTPVRDLPLFGGLPAETKPYGVDGTNLAVTVRLIPGASAWRTGGQHFSSAFNSSFRGGRGSPQENN